MLLIKPYIKVESCIDSDYILNQLELFGRICYKSEDRITNDSSKKFIKSIIERGHTSVLEHISISVRMICNRAISHEWVRHRLMDENEIPVWECHTAISQESSRYCNYKDKMTFIIPNWTENIKEGEQLMPLHQHDIYNLNKSEIIWLNTIHQAELGYLQLLSEGKKPEEARGVLPFDLKTEFIMTCNLTEWRHILKLRTSKKSHPQMREVAEMILKEFKKNIPIIFDDINN